MSNALCARRLIDALLGPHVADGIPVGMSEATRAQMEEAIREHRQQILDSAREYGTFGVCKPEPVSCMRRRRITNCKHVNN